MAARTTQKDYVGLMEHHGDEVGRLEEENARLRRVVEDLVYFGPALIDKEYDRGSPTIRRLIDEAKVALGAD